MLLIADTTVISNFAHANRLDLLRDIGNTCTTVEVMNELQAAKRRDVLHIDFSDILIETPMRPGRGSHVTDGKPHIVIRSR